MNLQNIKSKVEEVQFPGGIKALAEAVGMTEQNLHRCVRENKIQARDLEKISHTLGVSILCFFDESEVQVKLHNLNKKIQTAKTKDGNIQQLNESFVSGGISNGADAVLAERVKLLQQLIKEKDERINELKERVEELKGKK